VNKGYKFGTQFPLQVIYLLRQLVSFRGVFLLLGLISQLANFAIDLGLELVAADDFDDILCIRLQLGRVRLLTLGIQRHRRNKQKPNDQQPVHKSPIGFNGLGATVMPAAESSVACCCKSIISPPPRRDAAKLPHTNARND
jgi:hypothetical protein